MVFRRVQIPRMTPEVDGTILYFLISIFMDLESFQAPATLSSLLQSFRKLSNKLEVMSSLLWSLIRNMRYLIKSYYKRQWNLSLYNFYVERVFPTIIPLIFNVRMYFKSSKSFLKSVRTIHNLILFGIVL